MSRSTVVVKNLAESHHGAIKEPARPFRVPWSSAPSAARPAARHPVRRSPEKTRPLSFCATSATSAVAGRARCPAQSPLPPPCHALVFVTPTRHTGPLRPFQEPRVPRLPRCGRGASARVPASIRGAALTAPRTSASDRRTADRADEVQGRGPGPAAARYPSGVTDSTRDQRAEVARGLPRGEPRQ